MVRDRFFRAVTAGLMATLYFAPQRAQAGTPDSEESISVPASRPGLARARQYLRAGQTEQAERLVRAGLAYGADDSLLCLSGEIHFRRANFAEASSAFAAALARNPENARAHWGLGRIEQLHFRGDSARDRFARAFALDHRDIDIILSYADYVSDAAARATLLRNVAILARQEQPERAEQAIAQLRILERLEGRPPARLASPYSVYRLPLAGFRPAGASQDGVLVGVRINGGRPLRLLLDTGARGLAIDARSAKGLNLETIVNSSLGGFGDTAGGGSRLALARTVSFGKLEFDECLVEVSDHSLTSGADGVVGVDIFERFGIHLDPSARLLELAPFDAPSGGSDDSIQAIGVRKLLLVNARLEGGREGLFLVDTGAAFTSVAKHLVPATTQPGTPVNLLGAQGSPAAAVRVGPLEFNVGGRSMVDRAPVAMDLRRLSQIEGVEIAGVLGYSVLGKSSLRIDLRSGTVEFPKAR
jgi:hypothetical protein